MLDETIRLILREELEDLRKRIIENMGKADQTVTGKTRDSMQVEVQGLSGGGRSCWSEDLRRAGDRLPSVEQTA